MSNTLKFGNGQWATKEGSTLAYNDENDNFKPLPFNFERDSSATVINKDGLIETVGSGIPRVDYKDNTKGALLLEPSRTNYLLQSNLFSSGWVITGTGGSVGNSVSGAFSNLDGTSITLASGGLLYSSITPISSGVMSIYMRVPSGTVNVQLGDPIGSPYETKTLTTTWQRFSTVDTGSLGGLAIYNSQSGTTITIEVSAAQAEEGSYATSYIPTQGSAVTRLADSCSQTVPDGVIGQTEGTLFLDFKVLTEDTVNCNIFNTNKNTTNAIAVIRTRSSKKIQVQTFFNSVNANYLAISTCDIGDRIKLAFKYKNGDIKLYINGILENSATPTFTISSPLSEINLADNVTYFARKEGIDITSLQLYSTALTDQELKALTT